jgi:hypothetical protein
MPAASSMLERMNESLGNFGSVEITTVEVEAKFTAIQFIEDSTVSAVTDRGVTNADLTAFTSIAAGTIVYGKRSAITLSSGSAIGYIGK